MCQFVKTEIHSFLLEAGNHSKEFLVVPFLFACFLIWFEWIGCLVVWLTGWVFLFGWVSLWGFFFVSCHDF